MQIPVKNSFFDTHKSDFSFINPTPSHHDDLYTTPLLSASLTCLHSTLDLFKKGTFALHNQLLVCYSVPFLSFSLLFYQEELDDSAIEVLPLTNSHLKSLIPGETSHGRSEFGFQVTKCEVSYLFYAESQQIAEDWLNALKKICILSSFHDDYYAKKIIGKGGFAMVISIQIPY